MSAAEPTTHMNEITDFLAQRPSYEEIIAFKPTSSPGERLQYLMEHNNDGVITADERVELENIVLLGQLLALLQSKARLQLAHQS